MSRIDELIADLCPEGIQHSRLAEICDFNRGQWIKAEKLTPGDVPVVTSSQNISSWHNVSNRDGDTVVVASSGAYAGFISYWNQPIYLSNAFSVDPKNGTNLSPRFLFYALTTMQEAIHAKKSGGGVPNIYGSDIADMVIPVPPLEVQREIVAILDTFTELEAELEAEVEARKRQYEYYREALLRLDGKSGIKWIDELCPDGVERKALGEVIRLNFGTRITKSINSGSAYPVYGGGGESFRTDDFNREHEYVVSRFAMSEKCVRFVEGKFWMLDSGFTFDPVDNSVDKKFVAYTLLNMQPTIYGCSSQGAQKNLKTEQFRRFSIPLPPLEVQREIVNVLDKFDALVNDLSIGLPAELAARRKQYEYYRDQLLTFEDASA